MLLLLIVDPPSAIVVDNCINGKRPVSHAKTLNVTLIITRLMGTLLALVVLPWMAQYVLMAAHFVDRTFGGGKSTVVAQASSSADGLDYQFKVVHQPDGSLSLLLHAHNPEGAAKTVTYPTGAPCDFIVRRGDSVVWQYSAGTRATQAVVQVDLEPHEVKKFETTLSPDQVAALPQDAPLEFEAVHLLFKPVRLSVTLNPPAAKPAGKQGAGP
jgi:hypothetical protein